MRTTSNLAESYKEYILNTGLEVKCYNSLLSGDTDVCAGRGNIQRNHSWVDNM